MKASEARAMVEQSSKELEANDQSQYNDIMRNIQAEIKKNLSYEMWYYKTISKPLIKRLVDDGYKVENYSDQREGTMYKISWGKQITASDYYNK